MDNQNVAASQTSQVAPPDEHYKGKGALDAFLNLLSLVTLGWTAFSFGGVVFQIINKFFNPNRYVYGMESYYSGALKFNIASLLIVAPVFLVLTGILHKNYKEHKLNNASGIHKWLTYFMLFLAFCNIVGSLIALVFKFLDGEFFSAFILKALTVLVIALGIFGYYWYDLRRKDYALRSQLSLISTVAVAVLCAAAVVSGFVLIGSPQRSRQLNFDRQRVDDLYNIRWQIEDYYRINQKLPDSLTQLPQRPRLNDPESQTPYEYRTTDDRGFELCATFSLDALAGGTEYDYYRGPEAWNYHKAGRQCFSTSVNAIEEYGKPVPVPAPVVPSQP